MKLRPPGSSSRDLPRASSASSAVSGSERGERARPRRKHDDPCGRLARVEAAFELVERPSLQTVEGFPFAYARVRGAYQPWTRVATLDMVAETLELHGIDRTGPAFGIYHDLPYSERPVEEWRADLGWPVALGTRIPPLPQLRAMDLPSFEAVGLRYRGDLTSFPGALQFLVEWAAQKGIGLEGPLLERFHVSDALHGTEERDVWVALAPL